MPRVAWLTDIHLDFVDGPAIVSLAERITAGRPDLVVITGDISVAPGLEEHLSVLVSELTTPVYFVLGNHDYYGSSIANVRRLAEELTDSSAPLCWLGCSGVIELSERVSLIGVDGWGDGRLGAPETTPVVLNDFVRIRDLWSADREELISKVRALGDAEAARARELLAEALPRHDEVLFATHVPPFAEACWHEGGRSDDDWLPWFSCKAVGDALLDAAEAHPDRRLKVLCGHTHGSGTVTVRSNLEVLTGGALYGRPELQAILEVG